MSTDAADTTATAAAAGPGVTENFSEFRAQFFVTACKQSQKDVCALSQTIIEVKVTYPGACAPRWLDLTHAVSGCLRADS
jgi:hypothetical protein